jgi:hypothetical protein
VIPSSDSTPADAFRLRVTQKSVYSFDLGATAFVPAIRIYDGETAQLFSTAASSSSPNAKFSILLTPGDYTVVVSTRDKIGDYTLTTTRLEPAACQSSGVLSVGSTVEGALSSTDCTILDVVPGLVADTKVDVYSLSLTEAQTVTLAADSEAFPSMILVFDEKDRLVTYALNERFRTHAEVTALLPPGNYNVALTTILKLQGPYTLATRSEPAAKE